MALFLLAKCFFLALPASLGTMREQEAWVNHSNIFPISSIQSQERSLKIGNSATMHVELLQILKPTISVGQRGAPAESDNAVHISWIW